jgi:hypothetical protein
MNRTTEPRAHLHKAAGRAAARRRRSRRWQQGEAWVIGTLGLAGLLVILYAASQYTGW